ncbi:MAG TPA: glycosyl transferase, partial [Xanthobacteraceae bacterium]|nr:glycosyl transferase [Xanthobacteraceae bacterium]
MTSSLTCDTITDAAGLEAIAPEWWRLWAECARATPFQTPAWLLAWWTTFAPGDLCAVAIRRDGRLAGLAPFYLAHDHEGRRILPLGLSVTDYHDVLLAPGQEESAATALISHMSSAPWDAWELTELQPEAEALRLAPPSGCEVRSEVASACPVLALPSRVEDLPRHFPRRKRRALRTAHN